MTAKAPCWNCGKYTPQRIGSGVFCSWDCAVLWDRGVSADKSENEVQTDHESR